MTDNQTFAKLSGINVRDKVEKKGNLDYLSWAWAWTILQTECPNSKRTVYEDPATGLNYFTDGKTAYVKVGITVGDVEHIDYLPIMDHRNNSIPVANIKSMDVNKTIQRSTTKAIAMHGIGLSLWTGEDLSDEGSSAQAEVKRKRSESKAVETLPTLAIATENWEKVKGYVLSLKGTKDFDTVMSQILRKYTITPAVKKELEAIYTNE